MLRLTAFALRLVRLAVPRAWAALLVAPTLALGAPRVACDGAHRIRLNSPVQLDAQERAEWQAMPPLRVVAVNAPPLTAYNARQQSYEGLSADVLCFIARQTGLRYEIHPALTLSVAGKIRLVQTGGADLFMPLSHTPERARLGTFTRPIFENHYAVIARKGRRLDLQHTRDLARYRVGIVGGVAPEPLLRELIPPSQFSTFDESFAPGGLFPAVRDGAIDAAVFSKQFFIEQRYARELFDLEVVHTLSEYPRAYGFYLGPTAKHQRLAALFDRYLTAMDTSASLAAHEVGEQQLIERYVAQRQQRTLLQWASVAVAVLALVLVVALRHYLQLTLRLRASNAQILAQQQALQQANEALEKRSQTDELTQLANRRHFDHTLAREHARHQRTGSPLSLLLIDADHFKLVNDHYGHVAGDDYLRAIARVLARTASRTTDLTARYGGEEFACLLPDTSAAEAHALAERMRNAVAALRLPHAWADSPHLTVSIGVATLQAGPHDAPRLVAAADAQLYAAKHAGRNRVRSTVLAIDPLSASHP